MGEGVENFQGLHTRKGKICRARKLVEHGFCIKTYKNSNVSGDDTAICDVSLRMSNTLLVPPNLCLTVLADLNEASVNVKPKVLKVIWIKCFHTYDLV
jgi:hypothetical protein